MGYVERMSVGNCVKDVRACTHALQASLETSFPQVVAHGHPGGDVDRRGRSWTATAVPGGEHKLAAERSRRLTMSPNAIAPELEDLIVAAGKLNLAVVRSTSAGSYRALEPFVSTATGRAAVVEALRPPSDETARVPWAEPVVHEGSAGRS